MRILLIRHGESMGNVDRDVHRQMADHAIPLSDTGRAQAAYAGTWLKTWSREHPPEGSPYRIWTSPYARTRQTAEGVISGVGAELVRDVREHVLLCEQQFGLFDGIPNEELPELFPLEHAHYAKQEQFEGRFWARMPLGESRFDVATRVHQSFGTFHRDNDRHGIANVIVVCHGVTLRAFVMMWCHRSPEWFEEEPNPKNCAIRLIEDGEDQGYIFEGFSEGATPADLTASAP